MSPAIPTDTPLRLATLNVGCALTRKLPDILARCTSLALDVIALQEIGDPVVSTASLSHHFLVVAPGPSSHTAGVGLLIARELAPRCRAYKRSDGGRLIGAILELTRGHRLLVVSAYMPSGLDHLPATCDEAAVAHALYAEIEEWSIGVHQVVVLGDLNETLTAHDRIPSSARAASSAVPSPITALVQGGFTDAYRLLNPDAIAAPGFTHIIASALRPSSSRIDYIWTRGIDRAAHVSIAIDHHLHAISHHRLLLLEIIVQQPAGDDAHLVQLRLPNMRAATPRHEQAFLKRLDRRIMHRHEELLALASSDDSLSLDTIAATLTSLTREAAFATLPITGAAPLQSGTARRLQRRREDLTRILNTAVQLLRTGCTSLPRSPEWVRLFARCTRIHRVQWAVHVSTPRARADAHACNIAWVAETRELVRRARATVAKEKHRMAVARIVRFDANPAAAVHRMLKSDALPSHLYSVVDSDGTLTSSAVELKAVMVDHFTSVFAIPPPDGRALPYPPPAMLLDKPSICREWYDGLMVDVATDELLLSVSDAPRTSAPGQDEVATGVWKVALQGSEHSRELVASLFSSCLRTSTFPSAWKNSIIIPFVKDTQKERTMNNIRPISLQSCLGKLLNKILARRLAAILARYPILHAAQRGFITGGTTIKCIDELLDAWDWSRTHKQEQYTLFYDIKQAYDSVQSTSMLRALRRLRLPAAFVDLIADSLSGLTSCVRTVYGLTQSFPVLRSLRQGDPLAPLLFVLLMDALHDGLEQHPLTLVRHGCRMASAGELVYLPSLGYADDTAVIATTLLDLRAQNEWVQYFMVFNVLRLNSLKCELVGRRSDGEPVSEADIIAAGVCIDGHAIVPRAHDAAIRYLGVHSCFDGSWAPQQRKTLAMISLFARVVRKFKLSVARAVYMYNVFLLPKLELALHYIHGPHTSEWLKSCDRILIGSIKHAVRSDLRLSNTAVAMAIGLGLPSRLETSIKASELFLRMNSSDARWGSLGRMLMRSQCSSVVDASAPLRGPNVGTRLTRASRLAQRELSWDLHLTKYGGSAPRAARRRHLFEAEPASSLPRHDAASSIAPVLHTTTPSMLAHDAWSGWGTAHPSQSIDVYTDGSFDRASNTSSWSVVIGDAWFDDNHASIPHDENLMSAAHVGGATLIGASIGCTQGVYPAELQAIARALAMTPASFSLHIHSDSRSSLQAITAFESQTNERQRQRMAGRPLLQLISHQLAIRQAAGGGVRLSHVKAHTANTDRDSNGNRIADYHANRARSRADRSYPLTLCELPLARCESFMHVVQRARNASQLIDDPRRSAVRHMRERALILWRAKPAQGALACEGMIELGRSAMRSGSPIQQSTLVHVATNSIQFRWVRADPDGAPDSLQELECSPCQRALTLAHVAVCPHSRPFRNTLRDALIASMGTHPTATAWLSPRRTQPLAVLMDGLFPPAPDPPPDDLGPPPLTDEAQAACMMIGAFTSSASTAAAKSLGFASPRDGRDVMDAWRMTCLTHTHTFYADLKGRA